MLDGTITISKTNSYTKLGESSNFISISIQDNKSRVHVININMDLEDFAKAVTGEAFMPIKYELNQYRISYLGKKRIIEDRHIEYTGDRTSNREYLEFWLLNNVKEPGWNLEVNLNSCDSVFYRDDKMFLKYRVYKYVFEMKEEQDEN